MRPVTPDKDLAALVGSDPLPRPQIVKKLWVYIKKQGVQDGRTINADAKLKKLFDGKESVTMFELAKCISKHIKG